MEERAGNSRAAQLVFQRSMRESMYSNEEGDEVIPESSTAKVEASINGASSLKEKNVEVEVSRWITESNELDAEVWINNGSIEGKVPAKMMAKLRKGDSYGANRR